MCLERARALPRKGRRFVNKHRDYVRAAGTLDVVFLFSCFGDRLWAFSIGLFVSGIGGLTWVAMGQLFDSVLKFIMLPIVGDWLDKGHRHFGMQLILLCNNVFIAFSAIAFYFSLSSHSEDDIFSANFLLVVALILNALSRVASEAQRAAFTKDWIVVIVEESGVGKLSTHNTVCGMIDHTAAFAAPFLSGVAMETLGRPATALVFMCWNLFSWAIESLVIRHLYYSTPALRVRDESTKSKSESCCGCSVGVYLRQRCFRPAFALALLFMTVLGFDNIAIAYGDGQGVSPITLGWFRSIGSGLGIIGMWVYKGLNVGRVHLVAIGLFGLIFQNIFLNLCTVSIFLPGNQFDFRGYFANTTFEEWSSKTMQSIFHFNVPQSDNVTALLGGPDPAADHDLGWMWQNSPSLLFFFLGITGARFGLWIADPAVQEIMQETIPENERYRVNLTQNAIQELFSVLKDILVVIFPLAPTFGGLIVMSVSFVFIGLCLYTSYFVTEGFPLRRKKSPSSEVEMSRLEFKVTEPGVHAELAELLEKSDKPRDGDSSAEAPLQTTRTEGL